MKRLVTGCVAVFAATCFFSSLQVTPVMAAGATLCKANETPCGSHYALGTEFKATLKPGTFLRKVLAVEQGEGELSSCEGVEGAEASQIGGRTTTTGSESSSVEILVGPLTFGHCIPCKVEVLKNGTLRIEHVPGTMNGKVTWSGFEIRETCGLLVCTWGGETKEGITLEGGSEATLRFTKAPVKKIGPCSFSTLYWTGEYAVSAPKPLYVSSG